MPDPREYGLPVQVETAPDGTVTGLDFGDTWKGVRELYEDTYGIGTVERDIEAMTAKDFGIPYPAGTHEVTGGIAAVLVHDHGQVDVKYVCGEQ